VGFVLYICTITCLYFLSSVLCCWLRLQHVNDVRFVFTLSCLYEGSCLICPIICLYFLSYLCLFARVQHVSTIWLTWRVSYKKREPFASTWVHSRFLVDVAHPFSIMCCVFCFVCLRSVSLCTQCCQCLSGLSIIDCPFGFLLRLFID
jgi:hypothetical protein